MPSSERRQPADTDADADDQPARGSKKQRLQVQENGRTFNLNINFNETGMHTEQRKNHHGQNHGIDKLQQTTHRDKYLRQLYPDKYDNVEQDEIDDAVGAHGRGRRLIQPHVASGGWSVKGMKLPVFHHQVLNAAWMRRREEEEGACGGLIADVMGLGSK